MFRKQLKTAVYLAIFALPLLIVLFKPRSMNAIVLLDAGARPAGFFQSAAQEMRKFISYRDTYDAYVFLKKQNDLLKANAVMLRESLAASDRAQAIAVLVVP